MSTLNATHQAVMTLFREGSEDVQQSLRKLFGDQLKFNVADRIQTFEDACAENGVDPLQILPYSTPGHPLQKSINAYAKLIQIVKAFNEGKEPNWKDANQFKYWPWFWMNGQSGSGLSFGDYGDDHSAAYVASRLCLLNKEHVKIVATRFQSIYEEYMCQ